ncbi:MAG TPA: cytochrome C oxidase subunit I [Noviherbaspirillum sp.]|uniref:SCO family protein n=1 Tax=Noviherbaspirillum sp. TaxID=1926288 RepID=UPI002D50EB81|nr:cytochrome C oxidase subunit I [Noviherbaspirillum sp.]HYD93784.1 cytochrome C oxidase subunit I [Noviherbaspirillum sp.]
MEQSKQKNAGRWKLFLVLAVCASPVIASYLTYYVIKPEGRTNYGALVDPRAHPIPAALGAVSLDGKPASLDAYKGKWVMLQVGDAECGNDCRKRLYDMRQLRLAQGKDKDRIERVWLITDDKPLETMLMREYDGTHMLRARPDSLKSWLPADSGTTAADHIYMIDPLGNLMMRFPKDADPNKIKKDIAKLLKASRIG